MKLRDQIISIIAPMLDKEPTEIDLNQSFQDDLEKQDILMAIEDEMAIEFTDKENDEIQNISDIIEVLTQRSTNTQTDVKKPKPKQVDIKLAIKEAHDELLKEYYKTDSGKILSLIQYTDDKQKVQIEDFVQGSFSILKNATLENAKKNPGDISLINTVAYSALVNLIGRLKNPKFVPLLTHEFRYITYTGRKPEDGIKRHYELMQISGDIALALAQLDYSGPLDFMQDFLQWCKGRYDSNDFLLKIKYLEWVKTRNSKEASEYLEKQENGISFAVAALADMDAKEGLKAIRKKMMQNKNPIFQEVCKEAVDRLESRERKPKSNEQMINLFGTKTSTEQALGSETDNVFVMRARKRTLSDEIGQVTETDDSNFND